MICKPCRDQEHGDCPNLPSLTPTWCDCQHRDGFLLKPLPTMDERAALKAALESDNLEPTDC